jgi:hypothetical protein
MLRRFFKLIAGSVLTLVGIAIVIESIRFNRRPSMPERNGWNPISEFLLCAGVVIGGYGAHMAYSGWDPEAAEKFLKENSPISPSPGTPGEGRGEGLSPFPPTGGDEGEKPPFSSSAAPEKSAIDPHHNPLPDYRARGSEQNRPPDIGVQP